MRKLRLLGLAIVAVLSLSIVGSSTAQAVELKLLPELAKFSFKSKGSTFLETLAAKKIECKTVTGSGKGESQRLGSVEFKFKECTGPLGVKCTGLSDTEGNITANGSYHLRHLLSPSEAFVTLAVLVTGIHFSCLGILFVVSGCVASDDLLTAENGSNAVNTLLMSFFVNFLIKSGTKGDPAVPSIDTDNSLGMENCELLTKEGGGTAESSAQSGSGTVEKCESGGGACTFLIDLSGTQ